MIAGGAATFALIAFAPAAGAEEPLPPQISLTTLEVQELETLIFAMPFEDPNPDGSGSPHTFLMEVAPDVLFGKMFQVEEDGVTLGEQIVGLNIPITNSQGLVAYQSQFLQLIDVPFRYCVTNAFDLTSCITSFIKIIPINHPPVAEDRTTTFFEANPVVPVAFKYSDPNQDPLTLTLVSIPEQGDLYVHEVAPENLISQPGGTYPGGTQFIFDSGVEIDKWLPAGVSYFASFQYYVSDHEFDSDIVTNTFNLVRLDWGPKVWAEPALVGIAPSEEYVEFELVLEPYLTVPSAFVVSKVPAVGEIGFNISGESDGEWWIWIDFDPGAGGPGSGQPVPGLVPHPDGTYRTTLRYRHNGAPPTTPDDADMEMHFLILSFHEHHFPPDTPSYFKVEFEVLPYSCNPEYIEANGCHHSCPACEVDDECLENDDISVYFDGDGRYLDLGMIDEFGPAMNHGSVEMWIRTNYTDSPISLLRIGESITDDPDVIHYQFFDIVLTSQSTNLFVRQNSWVFGSEASNFYSLSRHYPVADLPDNQWHNLVVQFDTASNDMEVYINGEPRPFSSQSGNGGSGSMLPLSKPVRLAVTNYTGMELSEFFVGHMRELRFWNVLRTQDEILASMNGEIASDAPGLFGYWPLNDGAGTVAANLADASGATDGLLFNEPWWINSYEQDCGPICTLADLNCDGAVNVSDLLMLLANWGSCDDPNECPEDLNDDGTVNVNDLLILLSNWG